MQYVVAKRIIGGGLEAVEEPVPSIKTARADAYALIRRYHQLAIAVKEAENSPVRAVGDVYLSDADVITYHGFGGLVRGVYGLQSDGSIEPIERTKD